MPAYDADLRATLERNLLAHDRTEVDDPDLRHAAVAVAVVGDGEEACFVLTRRQQRLRSHGGQWALPGGRVDPGESPRQAALRELHEEVGVDDAEVLGLLDDYPTRSGYRITPVVVWLAPGAAMTANPAEVASIHRIPLAELQRDDSPRFVTSVADARGPVIQLPILDRRVHAPTAAVLYQLREVGLEGRATRVAHFDEPPFARA